MSKSNQDISNLLAFRDGEPVAADVAIDPEALKAVNELRDELHQLPDIAVDDAVWAQPKRPSPKWHRYPLSTAASVLVLSAVIAFGVGNGVFVGESETPQLSATTNDRSALVALMDRSQDLERIAYGSSAWQQQSAAPSPNGLSVSPLGEFILFQLAEVDGAIEEASLDKELTAQLWQQRVNLLQAFLAEMESQNPDRFENNRSM